MGHGQERLGVGVDVCGAQFSHGVRVCQSDLRRLGA